MKKRLLRAGLVLIPLLLCGWLLLSGVPAGSTEGRLRLNEVMAKNLVTLRDGDGRACDWIELYNGTGKPVSLEGYGLSNRKNDPYRWRFPAVTLEPDEYLVVFAAPQGSDPDALYCGFGLDGKGETLTLTDPAGNTVDSLTYPSIKWDVSYGRAINDSETLISFTSPTPGRANGAELGKVKLSVNHESAAFSHPSGVYGEPFALTLSCGEGTIVYTTDGTNPGVASPIYRRPIKITPDPEKPTIIRAAVYRDNQMGAIETSVYLGANPEYTHPIAVLVVDKEEMFGNAEGIYVDGALSNAIKARGIYQPYIGNHLLGESIEGAFWLDLEPSPQKVEVSLRGAASRVFVQQKSLSVEYDQPQMQDGVLRTRWRLRGVGGGECYNDCKIDRYIRTVSQSLDLGEMDGRLVNLFINETYWGLYELREEDSEEYWQTHFALSKGQVVTMETVKDKLTIFETDPDRIRPATIDTNSKSELEQLKQWYGQLYDSSLIDEAALEQVERMVDLDNFTDYLITNMFFGNVDWPHANVRLWKSAEAVPGNPYGDGRWRWRLYDLDYTLPTNDLLVNSFEQVGQSPVTREDATGLTALLYQRLWENPAYRQRFLERCRELLDTTFSRERLTRLLKEHLTEMEPDMAANLAVLGREMPQWEAAARTLEENLLLRWDYFSGLVDEMRAEQ